MMDQRCHKYSFGHYHQAPGASCGILYNPKFVAVCILHPTETQSPSHVQNTKDTPTITSLQFWSSRGPNGGSCGILYNPKFVAVCILHPTETQSPSHVQNTKDTPTITSLQYSSSRGPNGGSSALPRPSSYTAYPRMTAPGPINLCPSTLITIHSSYGCFFYFFII